MGEGEGKGTVIGGEADVECERAAAAAGPIFKVGAEIGSCNDGVRLQCGKRGSGRGTDARDAADKDTALILLLQRWSEDQTTIREGINEKNLSL